MSVNISIACKEDKAFLFAGAQTAGGRLAIKDIRTIDLPPPVPEGSEEEDEAPTASLDLEEIFDVEIGSTVALLESKKTLFERVVLPFSDPKHVEKVIALQIQDKIPFEVDDFIVDSCLSGSKGEGKFEHLSAFIPRSEVEASLHTFERVGIEPSLLTNNAFALTGIAVLAGQAFPSSFAIIECQEAFASIAVLIDGKIHAMRELSAMTTFGADQLMADLRCTLAEAEVTSDRRIEKIFLVGHKDAARSFSSISDCESTWLDLNSLLPSSASGIDLNQFPAAIGLLGHEFNPEATSETGEINFRQGEFAYKPTLSNIIAAAQEHYWNIGGAVALGILCFLAAWLVERSQLAKVESSIRKSVSAVLPGEPVAEGQEQSVLEGKVSELENQLREMGSLSSLSPLNSLKELSSTIPKQIDTHIESLKIDNSSIVIRGSLPNNPDWGKLDTILKSNNRKFCKVSVDNKGQLGQRYRFEAEVNLCE